MPPHRDGFAQRIEPKATWNDIVLPPQEFAGLRAVADRMRGRSTLDRILVFLKLRARGVAVLFAGEGAGKVTAAQAIANDLRRDVYRVDLSAVVSKYIGETEKNLGRVFDAAAGTGAILFFDEADALFGKRSEVKDAHDRYANAETAYLLQRLEAYDGLAILATNQKASIDPAWARRLYLTVTFA
jgi:SpoVK/Ycf46/Vps4 family AAA+-type ATPase